MLIHSLFYLRIGLSTENFNLRWKRCPCRNFIVDNCDKIDAEIIVGILKKNLPDFEAFKTAATVTFGTRKMSRDSAAVLPENLTDRAKVLDNVYVGSVCQRAARRAAF